MSLEKDKLSKLSPEDRIKRLEELEAERKKELEEIDVLLKKSKTDLKNESLAQRITPPRKDVDIGRLFSKEETEMSASRAEKNADLQEQEGPQYFAAQQMYQDYERLKEMLDYKLEPERMSEQEIQRLDQIESRLKHAAGYVISADTHAQLLSASRQALKRIKKYTGN